MTEREQWIRDYEFKNEWRRDVAQPDAHRCWECDILLTPAQARRWAHYCDPCRAKCHRVLGLKP